MRGQFHGRTSLAEAVALRCPWLDAENCRSSLHKHHCREFLRGFHAAARQENLTTSEAPCLNLLAKDGVTLERLLSLMPTSLYIVGPDMGKINGFSALWESFSH